MARWVATKLPRPGIPLDGFMAWHGVGLGAAAEGRRDKGERGAQQHGGRGSPRRPGSTLASLLSGSQALDWTRMSSAPIHSDARRQR